MLKKKLDGNKVYDLILENDLESFFFYICIEIFFLY